MANIIIISVGVFSISGIFIYAVRKDVSYLKDVEDQINVVREALQVTMGLSSPKKNTNFVVKDKDLTEEEWNFIAGKIHGEVKEMNGSRLSFHPKVHVGRLLRVSNPLSTIAQRAHSESPARWAIGLCIIVGVAGTFLGITVGLFGAETGSVEGTEQLIDGMKSAFFTSLAGMIFAAILTGLTAYNKSKRQKTLEDAQDDIDQWTLPMSATRLLGQQDPKQAKHAADANQKAADQLVNTAEALQESVGKLTRAAEDLSADAIGESVGNSVSGAIDDQLQPVFQEISDELEILREIKADQGEETLKLLIEQMRDEVLKPMGEQLEQSAALTSKAITSVDELREVVEDAVSQMSDDLEDVRSFQDETLEQMRTFASDLQDHVETVMDESLQNVERVADDLTAMVKSGESAMEAQRVAFDESTEHAKQAFSEVGKRLGATLEAHTEEAEQMFDRVAKNVESVQNRFEDAFAEQNDILQSIGEEASSTMQEAGAELDASTEHIRTVLSQMREVTQEELEQFRVEYQENLEDFFISQNNLLEETLGEQRDALQEAVASLREAMHEGAEEQRELLDLVDTRLDSMVEDVEETSETMLQTVQQIEGFAERLGLMTGERTEELQDMTDELTKTVHILRSENEKIREEMRESHQISQEKLEEYIQRTEETQLRFFENADEAVSELGNKLLDITDGVDYAAETLVSAVEHQKQNGQ